MIFSLFAQFTFTKERVILSKFVLVLDNLKGQMQDDFKTAVFSANELLWYGLPDARDLRQVLKKGVS